MALSIFEMPTGSTPLSDDDTTGLIPTYLSTRDDLNLVEAENIAHARTMLFKRSSRYRDIDVLLDDYTLRDIHRMMFGDVWKWAGTYRVRLTNIGIMPDQIPMAVRNLLLDTKELIKHCDRNNTESCDCLAMRFHWRLVSIHPFPNGNGRHARLMADLLIQSLGHPAFDWGPRDLVDADAMRDAYISALYDADDTGGDVSKLVSFARQTNL